MQVERRTLQQNSMHVSSAVHEMLIDSDDSVETARAEWEVLLNLTVSVADINKKGVGLMAQLSAG